MAYIMITTAAHLAMIVVTTARLATMITAAAHTHTTHVDHTTVTNPDPALDPPLILHQETLFAIVTLVTLTPLLRVA
ncbi:hypothetical protein N7488_009131 [Penicillium malachiteum]|nr:hypothetical protein N7488_009131 [Penicillium malachiteum]